MTTAAHRRRAFRPPALKRTVRLRLTLLYESLFLASSAALLAVTYGLAHSRLTGDLVSEGPGSGATGRGLVTASPPLAESLRAQQAADLHQFLIQSGIALAIMAAAATALGWATAAQTY